MTDEPADRNVKLKEKMRQKDGDLTGPKVGPRVCSPWSSKKPITDKPSWGKLVR